MTTSTASQPGLRTSDDDDFTERVKKLADWVKNGNDIQPDGGR